MNKKSHAPLIAVFGMILLLLLFVVFLLVYDDLRSKPFVQGTVGLVMSAIVAVVLFSIVYSRLHVKNAVLWGGAIGGGGAALFYLVLLPQIKPFIFPSQPLNGYVYYKRSDPQEALRPVKGVVAEIPSTGQRSPETDASGRFVIDAVYTDEKNLKFQFGGNTYEAKVNEERQYEVIPSPQFEPPPNKKVAAAQWQKSASLKCELRPGDGYASVTGFTLKADLSKDAEDLSRGAKYLHLKVSLPDGFGDITQPRIMSPANGINFAEPDDVARRNLGWRWSQVEASNVEANVGICVNRRAGETEPSPGVLQTVYWFGVRR